jgi:hypothetical protein
MHLIFKIRCIVLKTSHPVAITPIVFMTIYRSSELCLIMSIQSLQALFMQSIRSLHMLGASLSDIKAGVESLPSPPIIVPFSIATPTLPKNKRL